MVTIEQWFNGDKDYSTGVDIFRRYSKNRLLLESLTRKKNQSKLEYELIKLQQKFEKNVVQSVEEKKFSIEKTESQTFYQMIKNWFKKWLR